MNSEPSHTSFYPLFDEAALADNNMEIVEVQGQKVVLVKHQGQIHALQNVCPHLGGSLGRGTLKANCIVCPLHHWSFDLKTGKSVEGVPDEKVSVYETKVENNKIFIKFP